jgi:4-hydroxybenzoate polyprenyltransferase
MVDNPFNDEPGKVSMARAEEASDILESSPILRYLPMAWRPYARLARLDRPAGTWLLILPCWHGLAFALAASGAAIDWRMVYYTALFAIGALAMRGAGCVVNDIVDRNFDGKVARTALRPIPSGQVSVRQALLFMGALMAIGGVIVLQFNLLTIWIALASLPFVAMYPFMKRITWWPQLFLGLAFNWGALVGWAAITGELRVETFVLYAAGIFWTLGYDTIYAHQDKEDDALIGVKSTARLFQDNSRQWILAFYAGMIGWLLLAGFIAGLHWSFVGGLAMFGWHLMRQAKETDFDDPDDCLRTFQSNRDAGLILLAAFGLAIVFQP